MSKKIEPPEKEKLIEALATKKGRTNAIHYASETFKVSAPVIYKWIKEYGILFGDLGLVDCEQKEVIPPKEEHKNDEEPPIIDAGKIEVKNTNFETITITGKETTEIPQKLAFAEYDIGKSVVQVDFRASLVSINGMELPSEEAEAIADLLINIL
jgi:hypothetical protein